MAEVDDLYTLLELDRPRRPASWDMEAMRRGIRSVESAGQRDPYRAIGPDVRRRDGRTDRAYGAYQVMGDNIGPWSERHLGQRLTPEQFLASEDAQNRIFDAEFGSNLRRTNNPDDAASIWFSGRPLNQLSRRGSQRGDGFTSVPTYIQRFRTGMATPQTETPQRRQDEPSPVRPPPAGVPSDPNAQPNPTTPPPTERGTWTSYLQEPTNRAFLLAMGSQMMAGGWGNSLSQLGQAIGAGAEAAAGTARVAADEDFRFAQMENQNQEAERNRQSREGIAGRAADSRQAVAETRGEYMLARLAQSASGGDPRLQRQFMVTYQTEMGRLRTENQNATLFGRQAMTEEQMQQKAIDSAQRALDGARTTVQTARPAVPSADGTLPPAEQAARRERTGQPEEITPRVSGRAPFWPGQEDTRVMSAGKGSVQPVTPGGPLPTTPSTPPAATPAPAAGATPTGETYEQWQARLGTQLSNPQVRAQMREQAQRTPGARGQAALFYLDQYERSAR